MCHEASPLATSIVGEIALATPVLANPLTITKAQQAEVFQGSANCGTFRPFADCNNDPIAGHIPEPASMLLLGRRLPGLGLLYLYRNQTRRDA